MFSRGLILCFPINFFLLQISPMRIFADAIAWYAKDNLK